MPTKMRTTYHHHRFCYATDYSSDSTPYDQQARAHSRADAAHRWMDPRLDVQSVSSDSEEYP
ncbi:hypothetical protein [Sporisorium scitamineum]|uniref:Uncharacterized protein n=1 Tax=Sporisorium scitamineum TaxID=49012 RepID=A0A0F7S933_9BASI|nr:hypothetical protein [Sporisorium scitamineum]